MALWDWVFFLPTWINVLVLVVGALYIYGVWPYKTSRHDFPGPPPLPFIGNLHQIFSKGVAESDTANLKKYGKVTLTWAMRQPQLLVADPDMIKEVTVKQFSNFVNRAVTRNRFSLTKIEREQLTVLEDDHWKFVRATLSPAFSSGKLREMVPILQVCLENLQEAFADSSKEGKSFDVRKVFQAFTIDAISTTAFGMESCILKNPDDEFAKLLQKFFSRQVGFLVLLNMLFPFIAIILNKFEISTLPKESQETIDVISQNVRSNMKQRQQQNIVRRDLLQLMIDAKADDVDGADEELDMKALDNNIQRQRKHLTDSEVMAQSFIFLVAGYATTANTLSFLAYNLGINPECQEKLIEEIDAELKQEKPTYENVMKLPYLDMCLSETLRMFPPASRTTREGKDDIVIKGHLIRKGVSVQMPITYLHNNPEYWPEPEKFKPERFTAEEKAKRHPYVYLPFGLGPRNCVGMRLAQLETKMAIVAVLQKFRFIRSIDTEVPVKISKLGLSDPQNGIWLQMEARKDL